MCWTVVASQQVVCLFFGADGGVLLEFFFRDGLVVLWRSEDVRFFEGGHTVVCFQQ